VKTGGDSFMVAFEQPTDGVACAAAMQEAVTKPALTATDEAGKTWTIKLRIGVHQALEPLEPRSSPEYRADYLGSDINFAARVESIGAGGQILVSDSTHEAAKFGTPEQWKAWPNRRIKSFDQPETVWELLWDGQSRGEPGSRFLPDWFKGEQNLYIPRPELESAVLAHFGKLRPDGSVPRLLTLHAYGGMGKTRLAPPSPKPSAPRWAWRAKRRCPIRCSPPSAIRTCSCCLTTTSPWIATRCRAS
jgi:hypothetical protein